MKASDRLKQQAIIATLLDIPRDYGGKLDILNASLKQLATDPVAEQANIFQQIATFLKQDENLYSLYQNHFGQLLDRYDTTVKNKVGFPTGKPEDEASDEDLENFTLPAEQTIALSTKLNTLFDGDNPLLQLQEDRETYRQNHPNSDPYEYSDSICNL
ncbi:hypothetical protein Lepto7376_2508 [[Leptolyngbya] sp. PCC 7376]|uniref:hypothetical protein n=1 Tax=[Leptolyngbya] sp. PCC 7376 TaxID=111781 RepID=UPI00029F4341|nr:hypothetical protein [[Leptolyngbya] sp. PCC 7376]AFY38782.1 hypothetical protein Lepto7376_2508 [[Leptolyngbya] sp. PCC 7376]